MKSIRLRNVRSLSDTGALQIKPITLFLGQNSSGKSSVLRTLPLIKQSVSTRSNAPILWFGDYVDFGSVHEVRSKFAQDQSVYIEVDFGLIMVSRRYIYEATTSTRSLELKLSLELIEVDDRTRLKSFTITCEEDTFYAAIDSRGNTSSLIINDLDLTSFIPHDRFKFIVSDFVPQLVSRSTPDGARNLYFDSQGRGVDTATKEIRRMLSFGLHGRISEGTITSLARRVQYRPGGKFLEGLQNISTPLRSWKSFVGDLSQEHKHNDLQQLRALSMLSSIPQILWTLERRVSSISSSLSYVGPTRATGERYYRIQELAVGEIDPQGKNLAMFLHSLPSTQMRAFSIWLEDAIGYAIRVERSAGHIQIELRDQSTDVFYNIADMGYGFSQILPILAQVWSRRQRRQSNGLEAIVAMEQPELHLHPAYQAKVADVLSRSIREQAEETGNSILSGMKFIVETHSESIVNRIGELISSGNLLAEDVVLYVFEKGLNEQVTGIRQSTYDDDGTLNNWPIGFFSPISL